MHTTNNVPPGISAKIGRNLHNKHNHPIEIIKRKIYGCFDKNIFVMFDNLNPIVTIEDNFDKLLIPIDHPARRTSDTYYWDDEHVLRTHTSAHQNDLLIKGYKQFLVTGDVYRKDSVDFCHNNTFSQMEGVSIMEDGQDAEQELKNTLSGIIDVLFPGSQYRFSEDYFPFTNPSFEVEVLFNNKWIEVLGCGIVHPQILKNCNLEGRTAWAFGLGLERLAMVLFKIPDIRYFWSEDERFINQFSSGEIIEFKEYSSYPPITRDIAFWITDKFSENDFCEIAREHSTDIVESVNLIDEFTNKKGKTSKCYRIVYRSNERTLTNDEINEIQELVKKDVVEKLGVEIR